MTHFEQARPAWNAEQDHCRAFQGLRRCADGRAEVLRWVMAQLNVTSCANISAATAVGLGSLVPLPSKSCHARHKNMSPSSVSSRALIAASPLYFRQKCIQVTSNWRHKL